MHEYATQASGVPGPAERDPSMIELFGSEIERLGYTIDQLETRLEPVLKPAYDGPEKAGPTPTPVQSAMRDQGDRLSSRIGRLVQILDRLEV